MSEHTPGPWKLEDKPGAGLEIWATVDLGKSRCEATDTNTGPRLQPLYHVSVKPALNVGADGRAYAMLSYATWRQFPSVDFDAMQRANAQLIAAAPELLSALEFYVAICGNTAAQVSRETAREMHAQASAAIAKAKGAS